MKKQTGIWIDLRSAYLINLPVEKKGEAVVLHIPSGIEESAPIGGTRSESPWGPQGGDNQRSAQERRHHEEKHFFEAIIHAIDTATDELIIFGPSEAKHGLMNAIETHKHYHPVVKGVEGADHMSEKQMVAWVAKYFNREPKRRLPRRL